MTRATYTVCLDRDERIALTAPAGTGYVYAWFVINCAVNEESIELRNLPSSAIEVEVVDGEHGRLRRPGLSQDTYITVCNKSAVRVYGDLIVERHGSHKAGRAEVLPAVIGKASKRIDAVESWARMQIAGIEADERYRLPPALVQVNAPLALIQVEMKARVQALTQVLERLKP